MSAAASFTHYASSPRTLYRAILRELRKAAPPAPDAPSSSSLKAQASSNASSSADLRAAAQSQLAARAAPSISAPGSEVRRALPPFLKSPVLPFIRASLQTTSPTDGSASGPSAQGRTRLRDLADIELFMRSKRIHGDLLLRYNPTHGMTEQERVRLTARRVGLDVPQEYEPGSAEETNAMAAATLEGGASPGSGAGQKKGYTGPLPPPRFEED
ncbi:hypothetical protein V8E36_007851 [Tilletia maclaganii]